MASPRSYSENIDAPMNNPGLANGNDRLDSYSMNAPQLMGRLGSRELFKLNASLFEDGYVRVGILP